MEFRMNEATDAPKISETDNNKLSQEGREKYDSLMGDDDLPEDPSCIKKTEIGYVIEQVTSRTPENNGHWEGERGNSAWIPERDYIPPEKSKNPSDSPYSNPDNKNWGELMDKYGIDSIPFVEGYPDFSDISRGTVVIEGFETGGSVAKNHNFNKAYVGMAKEHNCSPEDVREWMKENNHTWHECEDKMTMQKVPNEIHANIAHDGGRSL